MHFRKKNVILVVLVDMNENFFSLQKMKADGNVNFGMVFLWR